ncbi:MAG: thiamine-phosphate kinase [Salaquimonas sp.]
MTQQPEETSLIQKYLAPLAGPAGLKLKDDAACLTPKPGTDLVLTADTIVADVHFIASDSPFDIAIKAITVNLSDLVAKGAQPVGYLVALSFPQKPDENWMAQFAAGLNIQINGKLLGGDMTVSKGGPLTITVTAVGEVPSGKMIRRSGARAGDKIFVGGNIGSKAIGLKCAQNAEWAIGSGLDEDELSELIEEYAAPLIAFPTELAHLVGVFASAGLDVSDGLVIDLQRLCTASELSAEVNLSDIPMHQSVRQLIGDDTAKLIDVITGGDDYIPLFTVAEERLEAFRKDPTSQYCTMIGQMMSGDKSVAFRQKDGNVLSLDGRSGYDHFSN